jgi:hypothetical protein
MSQEEYTQFIELYKKFNKKLDNICHIGFDKDLSYFDSAVINDNSIELRIEHEKRTQFIDLIEVIPIEILKYTDEEIKNYFIEKETELTNIKIKHYKESVRMAEDNISKMEKIKSLSDEISNEIIKAKHSVILRKSLIEEAEKRLNQYITHVNNF